MNGRCKKLGGYLVQIDEWNELKHVGLIIPSDGSGCIFRGTADEECEGRYHTDNDKKPANYLKWRIFQPDNWRNEDCVNMNVSVYSVSLNHLACGKSGRYIC
ncbi:Tk/rtkc protein kinase [Plakobranchus ocellatus]|uniref:Tk/rtkc protein kinase n=1 Tax=Plakobranchus ocellatus TaxID=259542 RepID=A0AAV4CAY4_9GAST|nr:Tk/rtkc protein kinase [Plakobranchus ocellatus]